MDLRFGPVFSLGNVRASASAAAILAQTKVVGEKMGNTYLKIQPAGQKESPGRSNGAGQARTSIGTRPVEVLEERIFQSMLTLERRRAERSRKPYVLMLLDANLENVASEGILKEAIGVIIGAKRETDLIGWYKTGAILGVIFTEVSAQPEIPITQTLRSKIETALIKNMGQERASRIAISMHTEG